jgi:recombinational DNA repair protein RecR
MDLGFVQTDENLWVKYTEGKIKVPHFILSTTINPTSQTFVLKNVITKEMMSTNSYQKIKEVIIASVRQYKLDKIFD